MATELARRNINSIAIARAGGWSSVDSVKRYTNDVELEHGAIMTAFGPGRRPCSGDAGARGPGGVDGGNGQAPQEVPSWRDRLRTMQELASWLTPALVVTLFAWLRVDLRELRREMNDRFDKVNKRMDDNARDVNKRFDDVNKRLDDVGRQMGELRERMAKLEGSLEGFLAGRRDRDAA